MESEEGVASLPGRVSVGHPVDVASGVVFTACDDFEVFGDPPLAWTRFYATNFSVVGLMGHGWRSPYEAYLLHTPEATLFSHDDGDVSFFFDTALKTWLATDHSLQLTFADSEARIWAWTEKLTYVFQPHPVLDGRWQLSAVETTFGASWRLGYDATDRLVSLARVGGCRLDLVYAAHGCLDGVTLTVSGGPPRWLVRYEYSARLDLLTAHIPGGSSVRYQYDSEQRMVQETNPLGGSFWFEYDHRGRCVHTWGEAGFGERRLRYVDTPKTSIVEDASGARWAYYCNPRGQVVREVDAVGASILTTFEPRGKPALVRTPNGDYFALAYDAFGNVIELTDCLGRKTIYRYGDLHLPVGVTHPDGTARAWAYDRHGNITSITDENGGEWQYVRDDSGQLVEYVTASGHRTTVTRSIDRRVVELRDAFGFRKFIYDELGNLTEMADDSGCIERRVYDDRMNLSAIVNSDGTAYAFRYDADGNVVEEVDELGQVTRYTLSCYGQILSKTFPDGARIDIQFEREGRLAAVRNEIGLVSEFRYNAVGNLVSQSFFDGRIERYGHDASGNLVRIDRPDGTFVTQTFDAVGNMVGRMSSNGESTAITYDRMDRIVRVVTETTEIEAEYDSLGQLIRERQNADEVRSEYDLEGNRIARQFMGGVIGKLICRYDGRRRLRRIEVAGRTVDEMAYDASNRLAARRLSAGAIESRAYGARGWLARQSVIDPYGVTLAQRDHAYDASGELLRVDDSFSGSVAYRYNARAWLVGEAVSGEENRYVDYDAAGNLESVGPLVAALDRGLVVALGETRYVYSDNAELRRTVLTQGWTDYRYDCAENLVEVGESGALKATFVYDGLRRRLIRQSGGATTRFVWSGQELIAEIPEGGPAIEYIGDGSDQLLEFVGPSLYSVVVNASRVPSEILDSAGVVVSRMRLDGFGGIRSLDGDGPHSPFRLSGQYAEPDLNLHYNRFRYFDPSTARFTSPDPIGLSGGLNQFRYSENTVSWEDPLGLKCKLVHFRIKANPRMGSRAEWRAKRDSFNAARGNPNARIPSKTDYDNRIRPAADKEAAAARRSVPHTSSQDADHPGDVRATGLLGQTLEPRPSSVNRSFGSQVGRQAGQRGTGDRTPMADLVDDKGSIIN